MEEQIKLRDIKSSIKKLSESSNIEEAELRADENIVYEAKKAQIELDGRQNYFSLRKRWSLLLKLLLSISIIFQFIVILLVGFGCLNYKEYSWFINLVMGENFFQIIGLCLIVVNFLFPKECRKEHLE
jgi:hypothetical protein